MHCLHPKKKVIVDALTGERKEILIPCHKCINCLHDEQDMWAIRLMESAKSSKSIIYDTLTLSSYKVRILVDFTKPTKDNKLYGTTERFALWKVNAIKKKFSSFHRYYPRYSRETYEYLKKNSFKVYGFPKKEVQDWLKRGREMYARDKGHRCDVSYFIVLEYGPKTSRPHFHLLMFGINYSDYCHYFGNCWREEFGWTCPTYKQFTATSKADFQRMTRYVSKYVNKGDFESPLVKDGLQPKPYRLISKGIGADYLNRSFFDKFRNPEYTKYMSIHRPSDQVIERKLEELDAIFDEKFRKEKKENYLNYVNACKKSVSDAMDCRARRDILGFDANYPTLDFDEDDLKFIQCYYDEGGFPHKLPQYYKSKLFHRGNEKNVYELEIQTLLSKSAILHTNTRLQAFAATLGIHIPDGWLTIESSAWKLPPRVVFVLNYMFSVAEKRENEIIAKRREIKLKNHYNRSLLKTNSI